MMPSNRHTPDSTSEWLPQGWRPVRDGVRRTALFIWLMLLLPAAAQAQSDDAVPLYDREPFDRITLDAKNKSAVIDVFPIAEFQGGIPSPLPSRDFTIRRIQDPPDIRYQLDGRAIATYERFQDLLLKEANLAIAADRTEEAFPLLARLNQIAPGTLGLKAAEEAFFFSDTRQLFAQRRYDESLLSLDQVFQRNPQRSGLDRALKNILSQILITEFAAGNYESVRGKLDFAQRKYGSIAGPLIKQWETELKKKANEQFALARQEFAAGNSSQALTALRRAEDTWPSIPGIAELRQAILAKHPRIRIGVSQAFQLDDQPHSVAPMLNWATRRGAPLVIRRVVLLEEYTVDGARYGSDLGQIQVAADRASLQLQLAPELIPAAHRIAHQLLQLADSNRIGFSPRWAEYVRDVYVDGRAIQIGFTRPSLRPDGLLPTMLRGADVADLMQHRFRAESDPDALTTSFFYTGNAATGTIQELTETVFDDPSDACDALLESRLDVVDRIHPADFDKLSDDPNVRLVPYRLPSIHGLVFSDRTTMLRNATFRRGLLYGINRATFLRQELSSTKKQSAQLLSAFAPIGRSENDPLGYAYSPDIRPRAYDPSLALVLMRLALRTQHRNDTSKSTGDSDESTQVDEAESDVAQDGIEAIDDPNALPELTLAYPDSYMVEAACEFIASNWRRLGIKVTLRPLDPGQAWPTDRDWDVLYIEAVIEEPMTDLPELILGHQILGRHGGLVWHAMRQLQDAVSLEDVRDEFAKIHRLTFDHTPMLPLWQIIEHAAVRKGFGGLTGSPITLYEDVDQWRLSP